MIYPIDPNTRDRALNKAQAIYLGRLAAIGEGNTLEARLARARLNLEWDGWRLQYEAEHDPYPRSPVNQEMMDDVQARIATDCPPPPPAEAMPRPAPWTNPAGQDVCTCQYCRGIKTHTYTKHDEFHIVGNGEIEHQ